MPENRQGKRNGSVPISSNLSVDYIQEAIRRLGIERHDKEEGEEVSHQTLYPDRPGEPDCIYYLRTGTCGYGSNCRFNHPAFVGQVGQYEGELPERVGQPECGYFLKTGTCKYGSTCKYHHPRDRHSAGPVLLNILGLPMRQEEKSCPYYMRTGSCKFGVACKFDHPQPSSAGTVLPPPASYGLTSLSIMHSSGLPYAGGLPGWSLPGETYMSGPHSQGPQTYVPVVLPPCQGMVPVQSWNTYTGSMSPVSSANVLGEPGHNGQQHIHQFPTSASHLPERPNQPECRYFMNTGSCKYGLDCKYNHPRDKISHVPASSLGPLGLPSRPGQAVCSYYSMYGLCKYGPTCKFDHPLMGYSYNYGLNPPTLSMLDPSFFPYQRNSSTLHLSEMTSPSKSSKFSNSIKKHEASSKKNPTPDPETPDDSPEVADSPAHSSPTSSELGHD